MNRKPKIGLAVSAGALALAAGLAAPAWAQEAATQIEEVVVTAQKRDQKLQDVPVAVSAFGERQLTNQAVQNLTDLSAKAPNVSVCDSRHDRSPETSPISPIASRIRLTVLS